MRTLVIDGSTAIGFVMRDEQDARALAALSMIEAGTPTLVPSHWWLEITNALLVAERRKRAPQADIMEALNLLQSLPVTTDDETSRRACGETAALARQYGLTSYDAAYLELAIRRGAVLATSDEALRKAAESAGLKTI